MSAALIRQLQARGRRLAQAAAARLRATVAQRWEGRGVLMDEGEALRLRGPGLNRQRRGTRARLADPNLLWPGDR